MVCAVPRPTQTQQRQPQLSGVNLPRLLPRPMSTDLIQHAQASPRPGPTSGNLRKLLPRPTEHQFVQAAGGYAVPGTTHILQEQQKLKSATASQSLLAATRPELATSTDASPLSASAVTQDDQPAATGACIISDNCMLDNFEKFQFII